MRATSTTRHMSGQYSQQYCTMDLIGIAFSRDSGNRTVGTLTLVNLYIHHSREYLPEVFRIFFFFLNNFIRIILFFVFSNQSLNTSFYLLLFFVSYVAIFNFTVINLSVRHIQGCLLTAIRDATLSTEC